MLNKRQGKKEYGFSGFNMSKKRSSISNGDWDKDGVKNKKDCQPLDHTKQDRCPKCGKSFEKGTHIISKKDNKTKLCPQCGIEETMVDFANAQRRQR